MTEPPFRSQEVLRNTRDNPPSKHRSPIKPLLFCGGRGEGREKQGQKMKKLLRLYQYKFSEVKEKISQMY